MEDVGPSVNSENDSGENDTTTLSDPQTSPIEEAKKVLEEQKVILQKITEERKKIEKITAENIVSGRGFAGMPQKREETPLEYVKRLEGMK